MRDTGGMRGSDWNSWNSWNERGDGQRSTSDSEQKGFSVPRPRSLSSATVPTLRVPSPSAPSDSGALHDQHATARHRPLSGPHGTGPHRVALDPQHSHVHAHTPLPRHTATRRSVTTARPVRAQDTALVEYSTRVLEAITVVQPVTVQEATRECRAVVAYDDESSTERLPVTIVPGATRTTAAMLPVVPPRGKARPLDSLITWALVVLAVASVVAGITPLSRDAMVASHPSPTGLWATLAESHNVLGVGGGAGPGVNAPGSAGAPASTHAPAPAPTAPKAAPPAAPPPSSGGGVLPAPVSPWPPSNPYMFVPGHPAFAMQDVNNFYYWAFGQCTWWAQYKRQDENFTRIGNAQYWASGAAARGYRVGSVPVAGATVVFQPGVQGAGGAGHVAHVEAVYPGGWFLISEMNFYWNGGGWGRVDYRYVHSGWGVQFIY